MFAVGERVVLVEPWPIGTSEYADGIRGGMQGTVEEIYTDHSRLPAMKVLVDGGQRVYTFRRRWERAVPGFQTIDDAF